MTTADTDSNSEFGSLFGDESDAGQSLSSPFMDDNAAEPFLSLQSDNMAAHPSSPTPWDAGDHDDQVSTQVQAADPVMSPEEMAAMEEQLRLLFEEADAEPASNTECPRQAEQAQSVRTADISLPKLPPEPLPVGLTQLDHDTAPQSTPELEQLDLEQLVFQLDSMTESVNRPVDAIDLTGTENDELDISTLTDRVSLGTMVPRRIDSDGQDTQFLLSVLQITRAGRNVDAVFAPFQLCLADKLDLMSRTKSYIIEHNIFRSPDTLELDWKAFLVDKALKLLKNDGWGAQYFPKRPSKPLPYTWPDDSTAIVFYYHGVLYRLISNERQRKYAQRKRGEKNTQSTCSDASKHLTLENMVPNNSFLALQPNSSDTSRPSPPTAAATNASLSHSAIIDNVFGDVNITLSIHEIPDLPALSPASFPSDSPLDLSDLPARQATPLSVNTPVSAPIINAIQRTPEESTPFTRHLAPCLPGEIYSMPTPPWIMSSRSSPEKDKGPICRHLSPQCKHKCGICSKETFQNLFFCSLCRLNSFFLFGPSPYLDIDPLSFGPSTCSHRSMACQHVCGLCNGRGGGDFIFCGVCPLRTIMFGVGGLDHSQKELPADSFPKAEQTDPPNPTNGPDDGDSSTPSTDALSVDSNKPLTGQKRKRSEVTQNIGGGPLRIPAHANLIYSIRFISNSKQVLPTWKFDHQKHPIIARNGFNYIRSLLGAELAIRKVSIMTPSDGLLEILSPEEWNSACVAVWNEDDFMDSTVRVRVDV